MGYRSTIIQFVIFIVAILLMLNINAVVDHFIHPEIPYFNEEHLIVGITNALVTAFLCALVFLYTTRLETNLEEYKFLQKANEKLISELQDALDNITSLTEILSRKTPKDSEMKDDFTEASGQDANSNTT